MNTIKRFLQEEDGLGVVEIILIVVVIIGLVVLFKEKITSVIKTIFNTINSNINNVG